MQVPVIDLGGIGAALKIADGCYPIDAYHSKEQPISRFVGINATRDWLMAYEHRKPQSLSVTFGFLLVHSDSSFWGDGEESLSVIRGSLFSRQTTFHQRADFINVLNCSFCSSVNTL
ncbi:hypothetical protein O9992_19870 [Vibrio lentus]|nr:hypothetical protein [Vibrio lentus]